MQVKKYYHCEGKQQVDIIIYNVHSIDLPWIRRDFLAN